MDMFKGQARTAVLYEVHRAGIMFGNPDFLIALAKKRSLAIFAEGTQVVEVDLDGTQEAV
jgi:hypothetical protein